MGLYEQTNELLIKAVTVYETSIDRIFGDYKEEKRLINEYNGRQILEMLQNADDAGSGHVQIKIDTKGKIFSILNTGGPFRVEGVASLMLANNSKKDKVNYIGNKGLGFRSIINWARSITIYSDGCRIHFSAANTASKFRALKLDTAELQIELQQRGFLPDAIPMAMLAMPDFTKYLTPEPYWATRVEIEYADDQEENIINQLTSIKEHHLIFLNNIKHLEIIGIDDRSSIFKKEIVPGSNPLVVNINDHCWVVCDHQDELPEEFQDSEKINRDYFNVKVAFKEDLSDEPDNLFNYFPSDIPIKLPCIVHGTFELDGSRKQIVNIEQNDFILNELVNLIVKASAHLHNPVADWNRYRMLTPLVSNSENPHVNTFYERLREKRDVQQLFPCVDGTYRSKEEVRDYGSIFSAFVQRHPYEEFSCLILPMPDGLFTPIGLNLWTSNEVRPRLEGYSRTFTDIGVRAELIDLVVAHIRYDSAQKLSLLIDQNGEEIPANIIAFTPPQNDNGQLSIPGFIKLRILSFQLFESLCKLIGTQKDALTAVQLRDRLSRHIELSLYRFDDITDKIISETQEAIRISSSEQSQNLTREMVSSLWLNYIRYGQQQPALKRDLKLLSRSSQLRFTKSLYLNGSYPGGELTEDIFSDTFTDNDFLLNLTDWNLQNISVGDKEQNAASFFIWLGVNELTRLEPCKETEGRTSAFLKYVSRRNPEIGERGLAVRIEGHLPASLEMMRSKLSLEQLILWVHKCPVLQRELESEKMISHIYKSASGAVNRDFKISPGFLAYHLASLHKTYDYVLEENNIAVINPNPVDYNCALFAKYNLGKLEVQTAMSRICALENFDALSEDQMYDRINSLPIIDPNGDFAQRIYKLALGWLDQNEVPKTRPVLKLHATKDGVKSYEYRPVYYSDNQSLPKRLTNRFAVLNLPKRSGEDKVSRLFGVTSFREVQTTVHSTTPIPMVLDQYFNAYFKQLKPYILAHRIDSLQSNRNDAAMAIRNCQIQLVSSCWYEFDGEKHEMQPFELINTKDKFYIMVPDTIDSVAKLREAPDFCDSFAEVLCILFRINEMKNTFRGLFMNGLKDAKHLTKEDLSSHVLEEVRQLLNLKDSVGEIWESIFEIKELPFPDRILDFVELRNLVSEYIGVDVVIPPEIISIVSPGLYYQQLHQWLIASNVSPERYFNYISDERGYLPYHHFQANNAIMDMDMEFQKSCYVRLLSSDTEARKTFISLLTGFGPKLKDRLPELLQHFNFEFLIDYPQIIRQEIKRSFDVTMDAENTKIPLINLYPDLFDNNDIEESNLGVEMRSLLYFEGHREELSQAVNNQLETRLLLLEEPRAIAFSINFYDSGKSTPIVLSSSGSSGNSWIAGPGFSGGNYKAGKSSEETVYIFLTDKYGEENVKWVSGYSKTPDRSDNLQYDMAYKHPDEGWKLVEVKTFSYNGFIISSPEVEKGKENPDIYELFLVSGNDIHRIPDFFKFSDEESFESNSKYSVRTKDFQVGLKISTE